MGGSGSNPMGMDGSTPVPAAPTATPSVDSLVPTSPTLATALPTDTNPYAKSLFGQNPNVNATLQSIFKGMQSMNGQQPQMPGVPASRTPEQVQIGSTQAMPTPSTNGIYPRTSLAKRGMTQG